MAEENLLEKTNRMNLLFDFYQELLTKKQQTFLSCYFHDNYSLGEIAAEFEISRQAVYEHIKRAEHALEEYERKLQLAAKYRLRRERLLELERQIASLPEDRRLPLSEWIQRMEEID